MKRLDPNKLYVEFREGVTPISPIIPRRYTLTHSDLTADLFLTVAPDYAYDKINPMRDEVFGQWCLINNEYVLFLYAYVDGKFFEGASDIRYRIFQRELPLAIEAIRYGDRRFFEAHPELDNSPIYVKFYSKYPEYNKVEYWGTPSDYK